MILEPQKIKSDTVSTVSPSISHEVMGPDAMIFVTLLYHSAIIVPNAIKFFHQCMAIYMEKFQKICNKTEKTYLCIKGLKVLT